MATHIYELSLNYNSAGQFCTNVLHYTFDDAGYTTTAAAANALLVKWDAIAKTQWLAMLPDQVILLSIKARQVGVGGGFEAVRLYATGNVGTRVGGISASGLSPVLIHYPLDRRRGRGKVFLPAVREADVSAGVFTDAFKAAIDTAVHTVFSDLVLAGGGTPTAHFVVKQNSGSPGYWTVNQTVLSDMLGQQRRRQRPA